MSKLLQAIEADAARCLEIPAGSRLATEEARFKRFLHRCQLRTRYSHNQGSSGREIVQARSLAVDLVFKYAFQAAAAFVGSVPGSRAGPCSIVALGGYGRRELSPNSDIDVQLLHNAPSLEGACRPAVMELMEGSWIYNVFPKVQVVVRTPAHAVEAGNKDLRSKTSLIEARLVCGDEALFDRMKKRVQAGCVARQENAYVAQRLEDQAQRRRRYGNTPYLQEPHLKNGCGGLRDYQNLLWMTFFRYGVATTGGLQERDLITERERTDLDRAYEYLLRVRNDLHFRNERSNDVLLKAVQPAVARAMGFHDGSPRKRVDRLMRVYYGHVANIHDITRNVEQRLALVPQPGRLPRLSDFLRARRRRAAYEVDGFKFVDGAVIPASERIFAEKPNRLMRAFFNAQSRGLQLHPELLQLIRAQVPLVTPAFRRDPVVREMFLAMLKHQGKVAPILRQMHEARFLGAFIPPFRRITARVQHEFYHQYTADEHTLMCLEKLEEIWEDKAPAFHPYAEMFRRLERPEILYLALLLHDTGKEDGPDHTESGARIAATVSRQLQLDDEAARRVQFLVRHHLAMVSISQKRNLGDPLVIRAFADLVQDVENLRALTLLTLADSMGTSDKLWTAFKDALLLTLYHRAQEHLQGQAVVAEELERKRLRDQLPALLPPGIAPDEVEAHFTGLPGTYFVHSEATDVAADLGVVHDFLRMQVFGTGHPLEPAVRCQACERHGCSVVRCCTWDRHGLFAMLTGAFTAANLNILSADIDTRNDGLAIDSFYVADPASNRPVQDRALEKFTALARGVLTGEINLAEVLRQRSASYQPAYTVASGDRLQTSIKFDQQPGAHRTIIEVDAEDRLGLLYTITTVLAGLGVDISLARINTTNGAASDAFYVCDQDGGPIQTVARQRQIRSALVAAIRELER